LTSYSLFQRDSDFYKENSVKFNYAILDEAQYIKNFRTKNAATVKEIDSDYRLAYLGLPLKTPWEKSGQFLNFLCQDF
jgi:SNF2 family DNA or RNA helicase